MKTYELIGGPLDGKKKKVKETTEKLVFPVPSSDRKHNYELRIVRGGKVFVHESLNI